MRNNQEAVKDAKSQKQIIEDTKIEISEAKSQDDLMDIYNNLAPNIQESLKPVFGEKKVQLEKEKK